MPFHPWRSSCCIVTFKSRMGTGMGISFPLPYCKLPTNWIKLRMGKGILNHLGITVQSSAMEFWNSYSFKLNFGTLFLDSCFQNHPDSVILQKHQYRWNHSFKHNLADMPSLNLTLIFLLKLGFICSLLTVTTQKGKACSPRTSCFIYALGISPLSFVITL